MSILKSNQILFEDADDRNARSDDIQRLFKLSTNLFDEMKIGIL